MDFKDALSSEFAFAKRTSKSTSLTKRRRGVHKKRIISDLFKLL